MLRTYKLAESDRICVLLTREHGKVRAVAHGVRKTSSRLGARMEVLDHVDVLLARGRTELALGPPGRSRSARRARSAATSRASSAAMVLVEVADAATLEHLEDPEYFEMVRRALGSLETRRGPVGRGDGVPLEDPRPRRRGAGPRPLRVVRRDVRARRVRPHRGRPPVRGRAAAGGRQPRGGRAAAPHARSAASPASSTRGDPRAPSEVASIAVEAMEAHVGRRLRAARVVDAL